MNRSNEIFKALADPTRRQLLDRLFAENGLSLGDLCARTQMSRQAVAQHLALLEAANLVTTIRRGREKLHYLNPVPIHQIYERWIQKFERTHLTVLSELKHELEGGTMEKAQHIYVTYIQTTPEKIWQAITQPEITRQYWGYENHSDWKAGSDWKHLQPGNPPTVMLVGKVTESTPPKRLVMWWVEPENIAVPDKYSRVAFDLETMGDMVKLTVTHDNLEPDSEMEHKINEGWPRVLSSMKTFLETGRPLNTWQEIEKARKVA